MRRRGGFSLVELLVAIAIIGILSAMLFPVFISAREHAKRKYCVNNMRQIYAALTLYSDDNNGYMPPAPTDVSANHDGSILANGFAPLRSYVKNCKNIFHCPNAGTKVGDEMSAGAMAAMATHESPYDLLLADGTTWVCSYNFWPQLYGSRMNGSAGVTLSGLALTTKRWTPGRLDCNIYDRDLFIADSQNVSPTRYTQAIEVGGPLVDNFLHYYGGTDKDRFGVLCLTIKGNVKFLPGGKYPW